MTRRHLSNADTFQASMPKHIAQIIDQHVRPLVTACALDAISFGRDPLTEIARSVYLAGFMDGHKAPPLRTADAEFDGVGLA